MILLLPNRHERPQRRRLFALSGMLAWLASSLAAAQPNTPTLRQPGELAPSFEARAAQAGEPRAWSLKAALQHGPVVLYFYPAAFTQGCSLQARAFAQQHERFQAAGASVLGVSQDPFDRLRAFSADPDSCAGRVAVASDADGRITAAYGVATRAVEPGRSNRRGEPIEHARADRVSFVVGRDGRIAATITGVSPEANVDEALATVQRLAQAPLVAPAVPSAAPAASPTPALAPAGDTRPTAAIAGVVAAGTSIELVGEGFRGTEGPLGLADGGWLFTENQGDRIARIAPDGRVSAWAQGLAGSNALALRSDGTLVAVQTAPPQVAVIDATGVRQVLARGWQGQGFGRPNDLVVDRQGRVWFTDSGPNANQPAVPGAAPPAVYRIDADGTLHRIATGIGRPNGIQLSPDERTLYVADTLGPHVLALDIAADGRTGAPRPFAALAGYRQTATGGSSGADGLAVDAEGRVFVASSAGVQVFEPDGRALGVIELPRAPQNLAFGGADRRTLLVVGRGAVWRLPVLTPGVATRAK
jgi:gluconolactonase